MKEPDRQRNLNTIIFVGKGADVLIFQTGRKRGLPTSVRLSQEQRPALPREHPPHCSGSAGLCPSLLPCLPPPISIPPWERQAPPAFVSWTDQKLAYSAHLYVLAIRTHYTTTYQQGTRQM